MIDEIAELVEEACGRETNVFGYGIWSHHLIDVVRHARALAAELDADREVIEIAALLHDYAAIADPELIAEHHVHGARLAREILAGYGYPDDGIEAVRACILSHRGSREVPRATIEARIVASADAMAHIDNVPALLHVAFTRRGLGIDEGVAWVLEKLGRSWAKLMPEARARTRDRYEAARGVLGAGDVRADRPPGRDDRVEGPATGLGPGADPGIRSAPHD